MTHLDRVIFFLMDTVMMSDLTDEQKAIFNQVRLRLQLLTVSDIVLAGSGIRIHPDLFRGVNHRSSRFNWPNVHEVSKAWIELFRSVIMHIIAPCLQSTSLGKWKPVGHQVWQYYEYNGCVRYKKYKRTYIGQQKTQLTDHVLQVDILERSCKVLSTKPEIDDVQIQVEAHNTVWGTNERTRLDETNLEDLYQCRMKILTK